MPHTARTAAEDLRLVAAYWPHLRALLDSTTPDVWPPAMGTDNQLGDADELPLALSHPQRLVTRTDEHGRVAYGCALCNYVGEGRAHPIREDRGATQLAEQPAPVRLHVLDTCTAIETALCELADEIAAEVQRPIISAPDRTWSPADRQRRLALVEVDAADPRRWHYTRTGRTTLRAAEWLLARWLDEPGICDPINGQQRVRIAAVARVAARRVERTIGAEQRHDRMPDDRPCPWCGAALTMHRIGSDAASVTCEKGLDCRAPVPVVDGRRTWAAPHELAALEAALGAAERRRKRAAARRRQRAAARGSGAAA